MRILHVYRTYFPDSQGGLEEVIRQICLNCAPHGADSRVFSLSRSPLPAVIQRDEAQVHRGKLHAEFASCGVSLTAIQQFREQARWADLIHYHFPWPFGDLLYFSSRVNRPSLLTYHSDIVRQRMLGRLYEPVMNRFLGSVDRIVCTSPNYFATSNVLSRFANKVEVVPIGLNEDSYPETSDAEVGSVEQRFGRDFFLFVGVLRYYKGLHILLEAIQDAPYPVVIVGSGPIEQELREQATVLGLRNVTFAGRVDDRTKVSLFKLARGVVFPSYLRSEAFGVTLLEGAVYGKPLVSTEVGSGTSHVNINNETGFVVEPGSAPALRKALDQLWSNRDVAGHFGRNARKRYERLFTGAVMGARYAGIYRRMLGQPDGDALARSAADRLTPLPDARQADLRSTGTEGGNRQPVA